MKKLNIMLIAFFALGACMLNPFTPPPPALDMNNPADKAKVDELISIVKDDFQVSDEDLAEQGITIEDDGSVRMDKDKIPPEFAEFEGMLPKDENGDIVLDLHSIEVQPDGSKQIVYKAGDNYIAAVMTTDENGNLVIDVKNTPTIDFGTIEWDKKGIYDTTLEKPPVVPTP